MSKKIIPLIERNASEELKAYFRDVSAEGGMPLDVHEELVFLEHCSGDVILSYINRFRFSERAEKIMLDKVPINVRVTYINYHGLCDEVQKYVIDQNLVDVAREFFKLRDLSDVDYLLVHGGSEMIRAYYDTHTFRTDEQILQLLRHKNSTLFTGYVNKGYFISDAIKHEIVRSENDAAFKALVYRYCRMFKSKAKNARDYKELVKKLSPYGLTPEQQIMVFDTFDRIMIEAMLMNIPLSVEAQDYMFKRNFDAQWFKLHVEHLYCVGGYRFEGENEAKLFRVLAKRNLDDCLTAFRHSDDVTFVKFASTDAVRKYIKNFWLTDDAQVALISGGNGALIKELLSRYTPEHGICWQAEVVLVKLNGRDLIDFYISFHTMCWEALEILKVSNPELHKKYYTLHQY